jgi:endonuclease/exonuclease/phosphatase family metal-dependent hydrolase
MRALQWNMGIFKPGDEPETEQRRAKLLASLLRERGPDLVALQEAPIELAKQVLLDASHEVAASAPRRRLVTGWHHSA